MPSAVIDGIATRYEVIGSGPPLLLYAPGGFNAVVETWSTQGIYAKIKLLDRDTAPGATPEDLMRLDIAALIVPGHDAAHATSAARYLEECLPRAEYWDVAVELQTEAATNARIAEFLAKTKVAF